MLTRLKTKKEMQKQIKFMSKEERFIQYSKLILALLCIGLISYFLSDKSILLVCK